MASEPKIWLLFGLPITLEQYEARTAAADSPERSDFLERYDDRTSSGAQRRRYFEERWSDAYVEDVAEPLAMLADKAGRFGCEVRQAATLADVRAAARQARVIIPFTHWKGGAFSAHDFPAEVDEQTKAVTVLVERDAPSLLAHIDDPLAAWLVGAMSGRPGGWMGLGRKPPMTAQEALRRCLDAPLRVKPPPGVAAVEQLQTSAASRRREQLDLWLAGRIRPGNRLELFDGLWDHRSLGRALEGFDGILDLVACTSTYLGDRLGQGAGHAFRTVQFPKPQDPAEAALRLALVLEAAGGDPDSYLEARSCVARALPALVEAETKRREGGKSWLA